MCQCIIVGLGFVSFTGYNFLRDFLFIITFIHMVSCISKNELDLYVQEIDISSNNTCSFPFLWHFSVYNSQVFCHIS